MKKVVAQVLQKHNNLFITVNRKLAIEWIDLKYSWSRISSTLRRLRGGKSIPKIRNLFPKLEISSQKNYQIQITWLKSVGFHCLFSKNLRKVTLTVNITRKWNPANSSKNHNFTSRWRKSHIRRFYMKTFIGKFPL